MSVKERQGRIQAVSIIHRCFEAYAQVHVLKCVYFDVKKTQSNGMCVYVSLFLQVFPAYLQRFLNEGMSVCFLALKCVCLSSGRPSLMHNT